MNDQKRQDFLQAYLKRELSHLIKPSQFNPSRSSLGRRFRLKQYVQHILVSKLQFKHIYSWLNIDKWKEDSQEVSNKNRYFFSGLEIVYDYEKAIFRISFRLHLAPFKKLENNDIDFMLIAFSFDPCQKINKKFQKGKQLNLFE